MCACIGEDAYQVSYPNKFVWKKLRMEKKVKYGKAYLENGKMPKDAEQTIKKVEAFIDLHPNATIGFLDGSSLQNRPNKCRVVNTATKVYQPPKGKRTQVLFGFMSINGNSCIKAIEKAIADQLIEFFLLIRACNGDGHPIGIVLDNASIDHSKAVQQAAISLDIHLIFLPLRTKLRAVILSSLLRACLEGLSAAKRPLLLEVPKDPHSTKVKRKRQMFKFEHLPPFRKTLLVKVLRN